MGASTAPALAGCVIPGVYLRELYRRQDAAILNEVYEHDCYRFRSIPVPNFQFLDVGAHIGFATMGFLRYHPRAAVCCVEAHSENFRVLEVNMRGMSQVCAVEGALTYDTGPIELHGTIYEGCITTGGSFVGAPGAHSRLRKADEYRTHQPVERITVEDIMRRMHWAHIDVVKLDAEGAELSVLEHGPIDRFGLITGEWHDRDRFLDLVKRRFQGWTFDVLRDAEFGLFRLAQPGWWNRLERVRRD